MPENNSTSNTTYLDSLQNWIANYDSPIDDIDVSFNGYVSDQYNRPVVIQDTLSNSEKGSGDNSNQRGLKPFWTWFLVAVGALIIITGVAYVRKKAKK